MPDTRARAPLRSSRASSGGRAPGPGVFSGLSGSLAFLRDPLAYFLELQASYGEIVRRRVGPLVFYTLFDPRLVREALVDHHDAYTKEGVIDELVPLLGRGLLVSEGALWKARREGIAPLIGRRSLPELAVAIEREADLRVERWDAARRAGFPLDVSADAMHFAIAVIGRVLFGLDLSARAEAISEAVETVARLALRRSSSLVKLPLRAPTSVNRSYRAAIARLDAIVYAALRDPSGEEPSLLPRLRELRDPNGAPLAERDLRDEAMSLLMAGHETTANTLAWAFDHLARDPSLQRRVGAEARERIDAGGALGLAPMPLLDAVVSECLRLAPPAWMIMRRVLTAHEVGGYAISPRSFVSVPIHAIQRNPVYWPEPECFRPERFLEGGDADSTAFLPFGLGPRRCPGEAFARVETRVFLAKILARFELEPLSPRPAPRPLATLRPAEHVHVRLR